MAKFTISTDDPTEARSILDALEGRAAPAPAAAPAPVTDTSRAAPQTGNDDDDDDDGTGDATREFDAIGMPYNPDLHTKTRTLNADGTWKARRGKADEAKSAAAAFKAGGGNVSPPADIPTGETRAPAAGMPTGMPQGMPTGMPQGVPADTPPVVTLERVVERTSELMGAGVLDMNTYGSLLHKHGIDVNDPTSTLGTNESVRAAFMADLDAIAG